MTPTSSESSATSQTMSDLYADLSSSSAAKSDAAATALATADQRSAAPAILKALRDDCAWEYVSAPKILALAMLASADFGIELISVLDGLKDEDIEDQPDDVYDEYWRLRKALTGVLVAMGARALPAIARGRASANPETRAVAEEANKQLANAGVAVEDAVDPKQAAGTPPQPAESQAPNALGAVERLIDEARHGRLAYDEFAHALMLGPVHVPLRSDPGPDGAAFNPFIVEGEQARLYVAAVTGSERIKTSGLKPAYVLALPQASWLFSRIALSPYGLVLNPGSDLGFAMEPSEVRRLAQKWKS